MPSLVTKRSGGEVRKVIGVQNPISKTLITFLQNEVASANLCIFSSEVSCLACDSDGHSMFLLPWFSKDLLTAPTQPTAAHAGAGAAPLHLERILLDNAVKGGTCALLRRARLKAPIQKDFPFLLEILLGLVLLLPVQLIS